MNARQTASHTDVLAITRNDRGLCIVAVEAKVDEDFGPLVKDKRAERSTGQHDRLDYLLNPCSGSRNWTMESDTNCFIAPPRQS